VAGNQSSPLPGNSPHEPAGKPENSIVKGEFAKILPRHFTPVPSSTITELSTRFQGMAESIGPMWTKPNPILGQDRRLPPVGPGPSQRNEGGRTHALLIVRDEFRPAIPRSGCSPALPVSASPALAIINLWTLRRKRNIIEQLLRLFPRVSQMGGTPPSVCIRVHPWPKAGAFFP
jgi:hypothetical protein